MGSGLTIRLLQLSAKNKHDPKPHHRCPHAITMSPAITGASKTQPSDTKGKFHRQC
jgi:hypothetical protein